MADDDCALPDGQVDGQVRLCEFCDAEMRWDAELNVWLMSCNCWYWEKEHEDDE